MKKRPLLERFFECLQQSDGCWTWTSSLLNGYGRFYVDGKYEFAHRVSYKLFNGPIPDGMCVCHRCDNPQCVNPSHLFLGTNLDNIRDRVEKKRNATGGNHGRSKLNAESVKLIRRELAKGRSPYSVSKDFGVASATIKQIEDGKAWSHVEKEDLVVVKRKNSRAIGKEDRFWGNIRKTDGCWEWMLSKDESGVGGLKWRGKSAAAHRVAYELSFGQIPEGLIVYRKCSNPSCCRPDHLAVGTYHESRTCRKENGKTAIGERNGRSKLTEEDVLSIRDDLAFGCSIRSIAERWSVDRKLISQIRDGKIWKHLLSGSSARMVYSARLASSQVGSGAIPGRALGFHHHHQGDTCDGQDEEEGLRKEVLTALGLGSP